MKEQILTLERTDDLHSLRDKIFRAQAGRILLLWPLLENSINRRLDFELIRRWARMAGSRLILISQDAEVRALAQAVSLPCFPTLEEASEAMLHPRRSDFPARKLLELVPHRKRIFPHRTERKPTPKPLRIALFLSGLVAAILPFALWYPSAVIRAEFPSRYITASQMMASVVTEDIEIQTEWTDRVTATGVANVPTTYATGIITITNIGVRTFSLPAGIRFLSENGIAFETVNGILLKPKATVDTPIRAVAPGSGSNLPAKAITVVSGSLSLELTAVNPLPTSGGAEKTRSIVTSGDVKNLEARISAEIQSQALTNLQQTAGPQKIVIADSIAVTFSPDDTADISVGSAADTVGMTVHALIKARLVSAEDARNQAQTILRNALLKGESLSDEGLKIEITTAPEQNAHLLTATGIAFQAPDQETIALALRGIGRDQVSGFMERQFGCPSEPVWTVQPAWLPILPLFAVRIEVEAIAATPSPT